MVPLNLGHIINPKGRLSKKTNPEKFWSFTKAGGTARVVEKQTVFGGLKKGQKA